MPRVFRKPEEIEVALTVEEEGVEVGKKNILNFIGPSLLAELDDPNNRINVTGSEPVADAHIADLANPHATKRLRSATLIVAASDSLDTTNADYVCDGTADEVQINEAIDALPATGGRVLLMDGTFNIDDSITMNKNAVSLVGQGKSTKILTDTAITMVSCATNTSYQLIKNIYFEGVNSAGCYAIDLDAYYSIITNCWFKNCYYNAIIRHNHNQIIANNCEGGRYGFNNAGGHYNVYANNVQNGGTYLVHITTGYWNSAVGNVGYSCSRVVNLSGYSCSAVGNVGRGCFAVVQIANDRCVASGNHGAYCSYVIYISGSDASTVTGNTGWRNSQRDIYLYSCNSCSITGNSFEDTTGTFSIYLNNSNYCSIIGNSMFNIDQDGIRVGGGDHNVISSNNIHDCSQDANNTYAGIFLTGTATYNVITGNRVSADAASKHKYGIREAAVANDWNLIHGNICTDAVTANISSQGVNSVVADNIAP